MIVTIHQPEFLPYIGLIQKIAAADVFVIYNDVQFEKNNYQNRNQIMQSGHAAFISVPINPASSKSFINEIPIRYPQWIDARDKIRKQISSEYKKAPYYDEVVTNILPPIFNDIDYSKLEELNIELITRILNYLEITTKVVISSELNLPGRSTEHLVNICSNLGATEYLSGQGGKKYMDESLFDNAGIKVTYFEPKIIEYPQIRTKVFIPYLSVIDGLFNHGKEFIKYIRNESTV
jgi:hypothetical protein